MRKVEAAVEIACQNWVYGESEHEAHADSDSELPVARLLRCRRIGNSKQPGTPFAIARFQDKPMQALGAAMSFATMTESTARPNSPSLSELIRFIHRQTQQQVRELAIHQRENRLVVTGRTATYYAKQLVTQAILTAAPAVQLVNEISVG